MKKWAKKVQPILMALQPYIIVLIIWLSEMDIWDKLLLDSSNVLLVYFIITFAINIFTIVSAVVLRKDSETAPSQMVKAALMMKLLHIPYHLMCAVINIILLLSSVVPGLIFVTPFFAFFLSVINYFVMLLTSSYSFAATKKSSLQGSLTKGERILYIVLNMIFCLDIVGTLLLLAKVKLIEKREQHENEMESIIEKSIR